MGLLKMLFGGRRIPEDKLNEFAIKKDEAMKKALGEMHNLVGHAFIPFHVGGTVDMYYFPNVIEGTAFATMELISYENKGPKANRNGMYELLAFTRHKINTQAGSMAGEFERTPFNEIERRMCATFTSVANYSYMAKLEPKETCEIPGAKGEENKCLLLEEFLGAEPFFEIDNKKYGFLTCIEIFRSEMEFAMQFGSEKLIELLKSEGHYPYSDLDRPPVA